MDAAERNEILTRYREHSRRFEAVAAARLSVVPELPPVSTAAAIAHAPSPREIEVLQLLEKTGPLTLEKRREMQRHSEIGERILSNVETYGQVAAIVRHHHERIDGAGYPDGLKGTEIPILARVIAVADAYNAMTSDRPYREAMASRIARLRLAQAVDSQFDFEVVAAFESVLARADESYRLARDVAVSEGSRAPWTAPVDLLATRA